MSCSTMAKTFVGRSVAAGASRVSPRSGVVTRAALKGSWLPGSATPDYLDGSLPGTFGFDPWRLGEEADRLAWYAEAERVHGRFAMLGAAGVLFPELLHGLGTGGPAAATPWYEAGAFDYGVDPKSLFAVQLFLFGWAETRRLQDWRKPNSANQDPIFTGNSVPSHDVGYPGGIFDPLGFAKGSDVDSLKLKEIKNGRLAMLGFAGFVAQWWTTGATPLKNLGDHLADPFGVNVFTNELAREVARHS